MGAGKFRVGAGRAATVVSAVAGTVVAGTVLLAGACGHAPSPASRATVSRGTVSRGTVSRATVQATSPPAVPTVTPSTVPVLGKLSFGTFPSTWDGTRALTVCEQWAGLRGEYVARVGRDTPFQLEQWFSGSVWRAAVDASGSLRADPAYGDISVAFGEATTGAAASIASARFLDKSCAAAD